MQFSQMYSSALDLELGTDDSTRLFTTARRKAAINRGVEEFADLTECLTRQSTVVSSHGVGEYDLLSTVNVPGGDLLRLSKQRPEFQHTSSGSTATVTYVSGEMFARRDVEWLNQYEPGWRTSTAGTPSFWYERMDGGKRLLGLYPPPEITSSESAKVVLNYVAKPQPLTDDTHVPFAFASTATGGSTGVRTDLDPYHQAVVHFAAYQLEKLRVNTEQSDRQLQVFLGYVQRCLQMMRPKGGQTVKLARSYLSESRRARGRDDLPAMRGWGY